jgi:hypothetical protein
VLRRSAKGLHRSLTGLAHIIDHFRYGRERRTGSTAL